MSKVNENLLYEMFNDGFYDVVIDRYGSLSSVEWESEYETYDNFIDYFDDYWEINSGVDESVFNATKQHLEDLLYSATYYSDRDEVYLQLHDNHTFWKIESEIDEYELTAILDDIAEEFTAQTGKTFYGLGRSGRHICVDFTLDNLENYEILKETALDLEQEFIDTVNAYGEE